MPPLFWTVLVGLLGGVAVAVQGPLVGAIGMRAGALASIFIVHAGGMLVAGILLLVRPGGQWSGWAAVPWPLYATGVLGAIVIGAINHTVPRIGAVATTALIIVSQLAVSAMLDHFGLLGLATRTISPLRILGLLLLIGGAWLVVRPS